MMQKDIGRAKSFTKYRARHAAKTSDFIIIMFTVQNLTFLYFD